VAEQTQERPQRSVPKPVFTDAEAGALEFPSSRSRTFNYFTPQKRRATVYEDVTVDVQPDPDRYLTQGWVYGFADGTSGYPQEWTALRSSDWHLFRDPNEEWERTIYHNNANVVRQIQQNVAQAKAAGAFALWSRDWRQVVERHVGAFMHCEHGLGMHVFLPAQRDAPTNMINNAISVMSTHKLRFAQDLVLYNLDVSEELPEFDGAAHKQAWQEDPHWQGVRRVAEGLTGIRDWAHAVFATNLVFEPLVGELFRSRFVMQVAALHGDYVTPTIMGAGESDYSRDLRGTMALFGLLARDPEHAEANRTTMQGWLEQWTPACVEAARRLQPIWSQLSDKAVRFEESFDQARGRCSELLAELDLTAPKEL
jgi:propane monooxygenase small subunit